MELKILVKNIFYLGSTKFLQLITQIVRAKLNALLIGVGGIGIYNQLNTFAAKTAQFSQLSVNEALVKQIAENKDDPAKFNQIFSSIKAYFYILIVIMLLVISLLILYNKYLSSYFLGDNANIQFYFIAVISLPIIFVNTLFFAILRGFKDVKNISRARIFAAFSNLIIFIPLIFGFGLKGVIYTIPIMYFVISGWNLYFLKKYILSPLDITIEKISKSKINRHSLNEMFIFSGFGFTVGFLGLISEFFIRGLIVNELGIEKIGIYVPIISWAGIFTGVVISSFNTYLFPRFCETTTNLETNGIINDSIRVSTFLLAPFILLFIVYRDQLLILFYSSEFLETAKYLPFHFFGIIWQVWFVILGQVMTPKGFIKQHGLFRGISFVLDMLIVFYFISIVKIGLYAWMLKFLITPIILFIVYYFFLNKKLRFNITPRNIILMAYLIFSVVLIVSIEYFWQKNMIYYLLPLILITLSYFLLDMTEKRYLNDKLLSAIRIKNK